MMKRCGFQIFSLFLLLLLSSCGGKKGENTLTGDSAKKSENEIITRASLLSIEERDGYDLVSIKKSPDDPRPSRYALVSDSSKTSGNLPEDAVRINVPLKAAVIDSEVYASLLEELEADSVIKGMFDTSFLSSPSLKEKVESGAVVDVGSPSEPNREKIIALSPQLITLSYFTGMDARNIEKAGVPVLKMMDLNESSPLGRAEWVRLFGRLVGQREKADSIFDTVSANYEDLKQTALQRSYRPKVLTELVYEGVWYVSGGASYQAQLIRDAGGRYFMDSDPQSGSVGLSVEQVLEKGNDADVWLIKIFGENLSKESLLAKDSRYGQFRPFTTGNIYFSDTSANSLFRDFPFHPDLLLKEYINIFSKDEEERDNLVYFKKIS